MMMICNEAFWDDQPPDNGDNLRSAGHKLQL